MQNNNYDSNILIDNNYPFLWIKFDDEKFRFLKTQILDVYYPRLNDNDKFLFLTNLVKILNFIYVKFDFFDRADQLWTQLLENSFVDLRAICNLMLPHINNDSDDSKKSNLQYFTELYTKMDHDNKFYFTNSQYNRCLRENVHKKIKIHYRPYLRDYFLQHIDLLLMSIDAASNKLYVNWINTRPILLSTYSTTNLYKRTVKKFIGTINKYNIIADNADIPLMKGYIDIADGLSIADYYNTVTNHLFYEVKNNKWLIYDIFVGNHTYTYSNYLENKINLTALWKGQSWSQLDNSQNNTFKSQWFDFLNSVDVYDNTILSKFYFFFGKYYKGSGELLAKKLLVLTGKSTDEDDDDDDDDDLKVTPQNTRDAKNGLRNVPVEDIYNYFYDCTTQLKRTWYYHVVYVQRKSAVLMANGIYVTPKNIYNYAKSLSHTVIDKRLYALGKTWYSLKQSDIEMMCYRILDKPHNIYNNPKNSWFNISRYIKRLYPNVDKNELQIINRDIHTLIRTIIINIIFESLIYHGLLSQLISTPVITNNELVQIAAQSSVEDVMNDYRYNEISKTVLNANHIAQYNENAYYFATGTNYAQVLNGDYFKSFIQNKYKWPYTYAMNWVNQLNFYHHYCQTRVMYITGGTGVGKSTQTPKLLLYCQRMIDFNARGKIICTQPRIDPVVDNANQISKEMGIPISNGDYATNNYYVQYQYSQKNHTSSIDSYLRVVTDGLLYQQIKSNAFLTSHVDIKNLLTMNNEPVNWVKSYTASNKYDIIIVDEAHEHNSNMDMILTLMRDCMYVNNSLKLVIVSATLDDDEPLYRRYYRTINDNRAYPLNGYIAQNELDRANVDRRIHISAPGQTTKYEIKDIYLSENESAQINANNFVDYSINKTIELANTTTEDNILLFLSGQSDILKAIEKINDKTPQNIICFGFYSELPESEKLFIRKIHLQLSKYTRYKQDVLLNENDVKRRVPVGTYTRAIIIATNIAEASLTLEKLKYVVDSGYAKVAVYDAIENINQLITLPISQSSSVQRRGRVGRVAPGIVYHMYSREKIIHNKTAYKIADSNPKDIYIDLLKTNVLDTKIITYINDINNIAKLNTIISKVDDTYSNTEYLLFDIFRNVDAYLDIILKQYMYINYENDIQNYYTWYGKQNILYLEQRSKFNGDLSQVDFDDFIKNNHDDYYYQMNLTPTGRCHTGYDEDVLQDQYLEFYLIHPDENIITRNLFTGEIASLKCSDSVKSNYYYYILATNNIIPPQTMNYECNTNTIKLTQNLVDSNQFVFQKYILAIDNAILDLSVYEIPNSDISTYKLKQNMPLNEILRDRKKLKHANNLSLYYNYINFVYTDMKPFQSTTIIKSNMFSNLNNFKQLMSINVLNNYNNNLWYCYAIAHSVENDVLAIMQMIANANTIKLWMPENAQSPLQIKKYMYVYGNKWGDIYFLWKTWFKIKNLIGFELLQQTQITMQLQTFFESQKIKYMNVIKNVTNHNDMEPKIYGIFKNLYETNKLNTKHEYYYFVLQYEIDFEANLKNLDSEIQFFATNNYLNVTTLKKFILDYFNTSYNISKKKWQYNYEIDNNINDTNNANNLQLYVEWIKTHFQLPKFTNVYNNIDDWDIILETYLRAYSTNLLKTKNNYYLTFNTATKIDVRYWSNNSNIENTFLNKKSDFLIYHHDEFVKDSTVVSYLTPVQIDWIIKLNPIYYYMFAKNNTLIYNADNEYVNQILKIIDTKLKNRNNRDLLDYLNALNDNTTNSVFKKLTI